MMCRLENASGCGNAITARSRASPRAMALAAASGFISIGRHMTNGSLIGAVTQPGQIVLMRTPLPRSRSRSEIA